MYEKKYIKCDNSNGWGKSLINKSDIARRFGCLYNTVDKYMNYDSIQSTTGNYTSELDSFKRIIIDKVDNYGANGR